MQVAPIHGKLGRPHRSALKRRTSVTTCHDTTLLLAAMSGIAERAIGTHPIRYPWEPGGGGGTDLFHVDKHGPAFSTFWFSGPLNLPEVVPDLGLSPLRHSSEVRVLFPLMDPIHKVQLRSLLILSSRESQGRTTGSLPRLLYKLALLVSTPGCRCSGCSTR